MGKYLLWMTDGRYVKASRADRAMLLSVKPEDRQLVALEAGVIVNVKQITFIIRNPHTDKD